MTRSAHPAHYREVCAIHGATLAQCRCPSRDKEERRVPCPGPPRCAPEGTRTARYSCPRCGATKEITDTHGRQAFPRQVPCGFRGCPEVALRTDDIQRAAAFATRAIPATVKLADAQRQGQGVTLTPDEVGAVVEMLQLLASGAKADKEGRRP